MKLQQKRFTKKRNLEFHGSWFWRILLELTFCRYKVESIFNIHSNDNSDSIEDVKSVVNKELMGPGWLLGFHAMHLIFPCISFCINVSLLLNVFIVTCFSFYIVKFSHAVWFQYLCCRCYKYSLWQFSVMRKTDLKPTSIEVL